MPKRQLRVGTQWLYVDEDEKILREAMSIQDEEQKKLLEQLASSLPKEKFEPTPVSQEDKGLFGRVKDIFG